MNYDEKAIVKIEKDGTVAKCAKGLAGGECGYKAGAKVCGKCGAMAVEVKMVPVMDIEDDEMMDDDEMVKMMAMRRAKKGMGMKPYEMDATEDEASMDEEEMTYQKMMMRRKKAAQAAAAMVEDDMADEEDDSLSAYLEPAAKGYRKGMGMPMAPDMDEEEYEDEEMEPMATPKGMRWGKRMMSYKETDDMDMDDEDMEMEDEEMEDEEMEAMPMRPGVAGGPAPDMEAMRMARLRKLGTKSADIGMNGFMCAIDRKVYPGSISVCNDCPGGCVAEKGLPGLLHVEGLAETMFKGDVIDSGYSAEADMFVVDVQTKSGHVNEIFIDGTTAEVLGFHRLDDSVFEQKSLMDDIELINFNEAAEIAVKSVPGTIVAVEPGVFEGFDAFQVEIDGFDAKSYDVYVALDGEVLGWDKWEPDDVDEIEAEAAEIALKRAFSEESRQQMAESGEAMEDGSFPIASEEDLRNAVMAHGRAKDMAAAKRHIMKRAQEMGMEKLIPTEWTAGEKAIQVTDGSTDEFLKSLVEFELLQTEVDDNK